MDPSVEGVALSAAIAVAAKVAAVVCVPLGAVDEGGGFRSLVVGGDRAG
jgi:hypothetical protein